MNYSQLKAQVAGRLEQRIDLDQVIDDYAQDRIAYWSKFFFYSSDVTDDSTFTTPGVSFYPLPNGIRNIQAMRLLIPGAAPVVSTTATNISFGRTTLFVTSTTGFPPSGKFNFGGITYTYTSVTATTFAGCSPELPEFVRGTPLVTAYLYPQTITTAAITLPSAAIPVASTAGFPTAGVLSVGGFSITYTSIDATDFLGCYGGAANVPQGAFVQQSTGIWIPLRKYKYADVLESDVLAPSNLSQPWAWVQFNTQFRLYSAPDQVYQLELTGNAAPPPPINDGDDNYWTEDAASLVIASTCGEIKEQYLDDAQGAQRFRAAENRERLALLKISTNIGDPLVLRGHL